MLYVTLEINILQIISQHLKKNHTSISVQLVMFESITVKKLFSIEPLVIIEDTVKYKLYFYF